MDHIKISTISVDIYFGFIYNIKQKEGFLWQINQSNKLNQSEK